MKTIAGFGYRFDKTLFVSLNPVVGGWPMTLEIDERVTLTPVTTLAATVEGVKMSASALVEGGFLKGDPAGAEQTWKVAKAERALRNAADRARARADRALEDAHAKVAALEAARRAGGAAK